MRIAIPASRKYNFSPLRYPGGKASLYPLIDSIIVNNELSDIKYIEPYAGGAAVALALLMLEKVDSVIINDYDKAIYSFWRAVLNDTEKFVSLIKKTPVTVEEWRRQKKVYEKKGENYVKLGFATFYLNRTNRSGVLNGGPIGGLNQEGEWKIDARYNKKNLIDRIRKIALYKNRIDLRNEDGIKLVKRYLGKKKTFTFLDPPYFVKGSCLYLNHYNEKDHTRLAKILNDNCSGHWILTYDNVKQIRALYPKRTINNFILNYHVTNSRKGSEILVISDDISI